MSRLAPGRNNADAKKSRHLSNFYQKIKIKNWENYRSNALPFGCAWDCYWVYATFLKAQWPAFLAEQPELTTKMFRDNILPKQASMVVYYRNFMNLILSRILDLKGA